MKLLYLNISTLFIILHITPANVVNLEKEGCSRIITLITDCKFHFSNQSGFLCKLHVYIYIYVLIAKLFIIGIKESKKISYAKIETILLLCFLLIKVTSILQNGINKRTHL